MHDEIIHNPKICLELMGHSMTSIRPLDYLSTPWISASQSVRYRPPGVNWTM